MTKYGAIKDERDGIVFASRAEARRYDELKLMEYAGEIMDLELQPRYPIIVDGIHVCTYVADFAYRTTATGQWTIEDVKGVRTPAYRLKRKLMYACYKITVQEVEA